MSENANYGWLSAFHRPVADKAPADLREQVASIVREAAQSNELVEYGIGAEEFADRILAITSALSEHQSPIPLEGE
jgi:hypothetical protein